MKNALVYFAEGFEEIEALTIVDVLRRAEIPTLMVSITGCLVVKGAHNISVLTDTLFEDIDHAGAEILVLPGGMPGSNNLNAHHGLKIQLKKFNDKGQKLAAICAAPLVLGEMDLLNGKEAVCYPGFEDKLKGAKVIYEPAVVSGNITTARGAGAALNFALELVAQLKGNDMADELARGMLVQTW